jgi:2-pyrone-4,6-dicarboxylate lactonase
MPDMQIAGASIPTCAPPLAHPSRPTLVLPPASCDAHFHIFGPGRRFPYAEGRPFTPPDAPKEALFALHRHLGFERGVIVQTTAHGTDHAALLDALEAGEGSYCGVALLSATTPVEEVARLDAAGICGVRFHFVPKLGAAPTLDDVWTIVRLVQPFGWHVAIHVIGNALLSVVDFIRAIELPVVIDHIARTDVSEGADGPAFTALRRLIDTGKVWVKLSGIDRISRQDPPFRDAIELARVIARQAPQRIVWGTDWPHPNARVMPDEGQLVDAIGEISADPGMRHLMLVENPSKLFRFRRQEKRL